MEGGFIKLYRELFRKPIWTGSTPEQRCVLITLLGMAVYRETEYDINGERRRLKPGQLFTSLEQISRECGKGISVQNIRSSLMRFEKLGFLTNESTMQGRLITLVNWGKYQGNTYEADKGSGRGATGVQHAWNKGTTVFPNIEEYQEKQETENMLNLYFTKFWDAYPKKQNRNDAWNVFRSLLPDRSLFYKMLEALERAKACPDWKKDGGRYIPYPARWLKACGWENVYTVSLQDCVPEQQCPQKINFTQRQYSPEYLNQFYVQDENPE